jgi:hypothetical protein
MKCVSRASLAAASVLALLAPLAATAQAQGFLDSLFGSAAAPPPPRYAAPTFPPIGPGYRTPAAPPPVSSGGYRPPREPLPMGGSYRTLCVRMCDGYYWPISSTASRRDFGRDAKLCKSGCSSEARLFFQGKAEADAATMVDLSGRVYARLPTAFKYRKSISSDCACKPAPWSPSEIDRHRSYAALRACRATWKTAPTATRGIAPSSVSRGEQG